MTGVYYSTKGGPELIDSLHYFPRDAYERFVRLRATDVRLGDDRFTYKLDGADEDATVTPRTWPVVGYTVMARSRATGEWRVMFTEPTKEEAEKLLSLFTDDEDITFKLGRIIAED